MDKRCTHLGTLQVHNAITSWKLKNTSLRLCVLRASCRHADTCALQSMCHSKVGFYFYISFLDVSIIPFFKKLVYVQYMRMRLVPPDEERLLAIVTSRPRSLSPCVWPSPPLTLAYTDHPETLASAFPLMISFPWGAYAWAVLAPISTGLEDQRGSGLVGGHRLGWGTSQEVNQTR